MGCEGQRFELIDVDRGSATAVWCELMIWVWRQSPLFADAEQALQTLTRVSQSAESRPGLWVVTEPGCEIPSVSVRRLIASQLRLCRRLKFHAASVEGEEAGGMLMRAAMRATAVAGGVRFTKIATDVSSVADELPEHFPGLGRAWGQHAVRAMRGAMASAPEPMPVSGTYRVTDGRLTTARAVLSAR